MLGKSLYWALLSLFGGLLAIAPPASAIDYTYIGPDNGIWNWNYHWSPLGIPGGGDTAQIPSGKIVSAGDGAKVGSLNLAPGGSLYIPDSSEFGCSYATNHGLIAGAGSIGSATGIYNSGSILAQGGNLTVVSHVAFVNEGTGMLGNTGPTDTLTLTIPAPWTFTGGEILPRGGKVNIFGGGYFKNVSMGETLSTADVFDMRGPSLNNTTFKDGTVNIIEARSFFRGANTNDATINVNFSLEFQKDEDNNQPVLHNFDTVNVNPTSYIAVVDPNTVATLTGTGTVLLIEGGLHGAGSYINDKDHTIRGTGFIGAPIENRNQIIAEGGKLHFHTGDVHQPDAGTLTTAGSSNTLSMFALNLYGGHLNPNGGEVRLQAVNIFGTTLGPGHITAGQTAEPSPLFVSLQGSLTTSAFFDISNGYTLSLFPQETNPVITNTGTFSVNSTGDLTQIQANITTAVFSGTGSIVLGGNDSRLTRTGEGAFRNDVDHTIRGSGTIDAPIINVGTIIAENGPLTINQPIKSKLSLGTGQIIVRQGGSLIVNADIQTGTFTMTRSPSLFVQDSRVIDLKGDFIFRQENENQWSWGVGSTLQMSGGGLQSLEVGGKDYGVDPQGFSSNFDLPLLKITESGTQVFLVDLFDNGNRSSNEALYVDDLFIAYGAILNLNGIHLYTPNGLVQPGIWGNGGGLVVPVPPTVLLLGSGLLGLLFRRIR